MSRSVKALVITCAAAAIPALSASAAPVELRVTVRNLAPTNSITFAPLRVGFGSGAFDSFNIGEAATAPIISIAEGGSGADWFPAFAAAEPGATLGTVVGMPAGPLLPGTSASVDFIVDPAVNRFFTFASMVVPSNDYFIGNDSPTAYELFDAMGNLNITQIDQHASDIWDAGSEADNVANAAFIMGSDNDARIEQGGVVSFDFEGLSLFNGLTTAAGYTFDLQLESDTPVYSISFEVVPAPSALALLGLTAAAARRRR